MSEINDENTKKDPYAVFRHFTFHYLHYYLTDFFKRYDIHNKPVMKDAGFGGQTLPYLLKGKDMHLDCYVRLLAVMQFYCPDEDKYMDFVMGFAKRAIIEIWLTWGLPPEGWMKSTWLEMKEEERNIMHRIS